MNRLLVIAVSCWLIGFLLAGVVNAAEPSSTYWTNNKHGVPMVLSSSHDTRFVFVQDCNGDAIVSFIDLDNYKASTVGRTITYKYRIDKGTTYSVQSQIEEMNGLYGIRMYPTLEQLQEFVVGDTLRVVYKLSDGAYGGMETYTLRGFTGALSKTGNACKSEASEYFDLAPGDRL